MEQGKNKVVVSIESGTIVRIILFLILFFVLYLIRDVLLILLTAVVLASAVELPAKWLMGKKVPRPLAVTMIYLLVVAAIAVIFYFIVPVFIDQAYSVALNLPRYAASFDISAFAERVGFLRNPGVLDTISSTFSAENVIGTLQSYFGRISGGVFHAASTVLGGVVSFVLIVIISFYLSVQENGIAHFLKVITPYKHQKYVVGLWKRAQMKIGRWMQGQLLLGLIIGAMVFAGLSLLGIRNAFLFAVIAGVLEMIPFFGPVLSAIPAVAVALTDGGLSSGLLVGGLYVIIQQFENHLVYPLVVNKVVGVPALLVIISLVVGGKLGGLLGGILAVPIAAALMEFVGDIQEEYRKREREEEASAA